MLEPPYMFLRDSRPGRETLLGAVSIDAAARTCMLEVFALAAGQEIRKDAPSVRLLMAPAEEAGRVNEIRREWAYVLGQDNAPDLSAFEEIPLAFEAFVSVWKNKGGVVEGSFVLPANNLTFRSMLHGPDEFVRLEIALADDVDAAWERMATVAPQETLGLLRFWRPHMVTGARSRARLRKPSSPEALTPLFEAHDSRVREQAMLLLPKLVRRPVRRRGRKQGRTSPAGPRLYVRARN